MKLNHAPEEWALVRPDAFLSGSIVQARNVIEMALQDIAALSDSINNLRGMLDEALPPYISGSVDYIEWEGRQSAALSNSSHTSGEQT